MTMIQVLTDTLQEVTGSGNVNSPVTLASLTIARTGHYVIGCQASHSGSWYSSGGDPFITMQMGGSAPIDGSYSPMSGTTSGHNGGVFGMSGSFGYIWHGTLSAGQTVSVSRNSWRCENAPTNVKLWAHFIPTPAYPK